MKVLGTCLDNERLNLVYSGADLFSVTVNMTQISVATNTGFASFDGLKSGLSQQAFECWLIEEEFMPPVMHHSIEHVYGIPNFCL